MHSRIFQITLSPVLPADWIKSESLPDWFGVEIADYADVIKDPGEDIRYFLEVNKEIFVPADEPGSFKLAPDARQKHFLSMFTKFKENLALMSTMSFEAFIGGGRGPQNKDAENWMYLLKESFCSKWGWYVFNESEELLPFDQWMRHAKQDETYYLGGVIDYHF